MATAKKKAKKKSKPQIIAFGWMPDLPDHRDMSATVLLAAAIPRKLPASYDMRKSFPAPLNQGSLGSCVNNAIAALVQFTEQEMRPLATRPLPSRLFGYFNGRVMQGTVAIDSGLSIRVGMKAYIKYGYCKEELWPYKIADFKKQPSVKAYDAAHGHMLMDSMYARVDQTAASIKSVLAANNPVVIGFSVYESFMAVKKNGQVPMPGPAEKLLGGHAVLLVGYDSVRKVFIFRNSWGDGFGDKGYGYLPEAYVLNPKLASDFWTIVAVPKES